MIAVIAAVLVAGAASFGVGGWVLPRPDSAARFRDRYLATGLAFCVTMLWLVRSVDQQLWFWAAFDGLAAMVWLGRAQRWYQLCESWRKMERTRQELATRQR